MQMARVAAFVILLFFVSLATAAQQVDITQSPSCLLCGMDRAKFSQSRMTIEYDDGSRVATCSLHCAALELANTIDKSPVMLLVADFDGKELIDAEKAIWVMGGGLKGVMTARSKWAFATREAAERFIKINGGSIASFDDVMKASYEDMYQDTKMIRDRRKMMRKK